MTRFPLLVVLLSVPSGVYAQAWTPARGEFDLGLSYQNSLVTDHTRSNGSRFDDGRIYSHGMLMDVTYGFTDKLALKVALPYLSSKYRGKTPHQLPLDGGLYHGAFQDFNAELRYKIAKHPLVITPSIAVVVPSHDYEYFAHSAVGQDLRELRLGVNLGRRLDPFLPNAFVQAQFSYRFVENVRFLEEVTVPEQPGKVLNISRKNGFAEAQFGYFVTRRLTLFGLGAWLDTYGGCSLRNGWHCPGEDPTVRHVAGGPPIGNYLHHDQISHQRQFNAGGGLAYQLSPKVAIFGVAVNTLKSANTHALAWGITVGTNWTFQTRGEGLKITRSQALGGNLAQLRCMCPKQ